jgi:microcin C transport system permease protein
MAWIKLDPITRRRFARFRKIKRGYYSFLILVVAIVLSIFSPFLAESRALFVSYKGTWYLPTFQYISGATFNQTPPPGWSGTDLEADYLRLQREWQVDVLLQSRAAQAGRLAAGGA